MHCTNCGQQISDTAPACSNCGRQVQRFAATAAAPATGIQNYLVPSILVTFCCCLPGGIIAIVYAAQVNGKLALGDVAGAMDYAKKAKMWCWISFGVAAVATLGYALIMGAAAITGNG